MKVGDMIPEFTLFDQNGKAFSSHSLLDKKHLVLFFYPKDGTPICIREACAFRDSYYDFVENGFEVVGISSDSIRNHKAFAKSYTLPYRLLSDEDGIARKLMKVPNSFFGLLPGRVTFVIDKNGIVRKVFNSALSASSHVKEAISTVVK